MKRIGHVGNALAMQAELRAMRNLYCSLGLDVVRCARCGSLFDQRGVCPRCNPKVR